MQAAEGSLPDVALAIAAVFVHMQEAIFSPLLKRGFTN